MNSLTIITLPVGQLQTNCYLVIDKETKNAFIIDPGDDADYIQRIITDKKCTAKKIIATHGHFDHILASLELQLAYNIPFIVHKKDEFLVKRMQQSAKHFLAIDVDPPPKINNYLKDKEILTLGKNEFEVIETPGHTPGSICLYSKKEKVLFVGDLIFAGGGVGRTDFHYSSEKDLYASIKKIFKLPGETRIFSGHGPESTISDESSLNTLSFF